MKRIIMWSILALATEKTLSQTHTETFTACGKSYTVVCSREIDNSIKVGIRKASFDTIKHEYPIVTDDLDLFAQTFKENFLTFLGNDSSTCSDNEKRNFFLSYGRKLFLNYVAANTLDSISPLAGTLRIKKDINIYLKEDAQTEYTTSYEKYKIQKVQIEIKEGFIENIKAYILINGKTYYFSNNYAIGFSSITNYENFNRVRLYEMFSNPFSKPGNALIYYYIKLNNLIEYDYNLEVDRRDYSPKNIKIVLNGGEAVTLHKETTKKLFEAKIFTDFVGLKEDKPNGLVQIEVNKRININTVQHQSRKSFYWIFKSYGALQYIAPSISISKLEEHNRQLSLGDLDSVRFNPGLTDTSRFKKSIHRYSTPLDLYKYQSFSAGLDCNILFFSNRNLKFNFYVNAGARLGISPVSDSLTTIGNQNAIKKTGFTRNYSINTLQFYPEVILTFLPEERFNFSISNKFLYLKPYANDMQVVSYAPKDNSILFAKKGSWLNIFEMLMALQVNPDSKLFGRVRFNSDWNNFNINFAQIQVGYSTFILGKK
ncbi:MAG: hypothetical protein H7Z13_12365 [Ferruginibacter sp.]|nr:hypothetical protein [Ferruginibacter sp.]